MKMIYYCANILCIFSSCSTIPERSSQSGFQKYQEEASKPILDESNLVDSQNLANSNNPSSPLSTLLTDEDRKLIMTREKVRMLERSISNSKMKEQYTRILPLFRSDREKIEFLSLNAIEDRQVWINKKGIWNRANLNPAEMKSLVENQDIAIGMTQEFVRRAWGEPLAVEVTGNPIYKNERWKYIRSLTLPDGFKQEKRLVYFEAGKVVGWETD